MQKNFSLRQNMQIPQENHYTGILDRNVFDELIDILSKNYEVHNAECVKDFIEKNKELLPYINKITPIINKHFPDYKKCITFCQDPEFKELDDITIYINSIESTFDTDWKKLDILENELFYIDDFSSKIKGLITVDLWLK